MKSPKVSLDYCLKILVITKTSSKQNWPSPVSTDGDYIRNKIST